VSYQSNNREKYESRNPLKRHFVKQFRTRFLAELQRVRPTLVLEAGCGEGIMTRAVLDAFPGVEMRALDIDERLVEQALALNPGANITQGSVLELPFEDKSFDTVVCSEVLEHLETPEDALRELCRVCSGTVVLSVPHEPWFRLGNIAGLAHLKTLGNPDGHIQHWSRRSFVNMVSKQITVESAVTLFPWIMVVGTPK